MQITDFILFHEVAQFLILIINLFLKCYQLTDDLRRILYVGSENVEIYGFHHRLIAASLNDLGLKLVCQVFHIGLLFLKNLLVLYYPKVDVRVILL